MALKRSPTWFNTKTQPPFRGVAVDWAHPLARGLTDYWLLNEAGGQTLNLVSGVLSTSTTLAPRRTSPRGTSPLFDGATSSRFFDNAISPLANGTNYTAWSLCFPTSVSVLQAPIDADFNASPDRMFQLRFQADNTYQFVPFNTTADAFVAAAGGTVVVNVQTSIAGTVNGTAIAVYKDGVSVGTDTLTGTLYSAGVTLTIGRRDTGPGLQFNGYVIVVGRWSRALSPSELQWLHFEPYAFLRPVVRRRWVATLPLLPSANEPMTVTEAQTMHLPIHLRMEKLS